MRSQASATGGIADDSELLRLRAERLARAPPSPDAQAGELSALEFSIGTRRCVLALDWVREVRALGELLDVPLAPAPLLGMVQLRSRMLPVLDLRGLLGIATAPKDRFTRLLVIGRESAALGLAATELHGVQAVRAAEAGRRSQPLESLRPELVRGVGPEGQLFLDGERLLALQHDAGP